MNCRFGSIAGRALAIPTGPKLSDQTGVPACASNAIRCPCSPCRYTRSRTPDFVVTLVSRTGAPSGASGSGTLNSCFSLPTLDRLTVLSTVVSADFCSSKANWSQSVTGGGAFAAVDCAEPAPAASGTRARASSPIAGTTSFDLDTGVASSAGPGLVAHAQPSLKQRCNRMHYGQCPFPPGESGADTRS